MAALVNGGRLIKPRIVSKVVANDGRILEERQNAPEVMRVLDIEPAILSEIMRGMMGVVEDKRGTGKRAALPESSGIRVGGKTGTAQVASRESGLNHEDHAWFAGFAPAENPRIIVVTLIENGGHGGEVAAPVTRKVMMKYFGIAEPSVEELAKKRQRQRNNRASSEPREVVSR
jgi:penicillin-binding protein 2